MPITSFVRPGLDWVYGMTSVIERSVVMKMNTVSKIGVIGLLLAVLSGCAGTKVVQLQPATADVIDERVDFFRLRHMSGGQSDRDGEAPYSTQLLIFPAVVIDVQEEMSTSPNHTISASDLMAWEDQYGRIPRGSVVLLHTGWKEGWERPDLYASGEFRLPACDGSVTPFLLNDRRVAGVGIDRKSHFELDEANDELDIDELDMAKTLLNQWVSNQEGIVLENLENLGQLPPTGVNLQIGILYREELNTQSIVSVKAFIPEKTK
ncbi:hypothetical protein GF339_23450 [candidate division KSB3 bacterium]|uniref:Uncharacterized protein n=1 Tax=candidate division KSB3 bacterium TaxID=2044937 RepID=A0A9D5K116_9BACT|nr:hypothetical protein [candidate division KSB3 bacterium]MBD3327560.1 hypothetical protein [candidate division KSB3 bacterium]